jgi:hypothetical protein
MLKYYVDDREVTEPEAAAVWFGRADDRGIDVSKAISVWEDAAAPEGDASRELVAHAGIRVQVSQK